MTDQAHSPLGPSAAYRWINCPGSVNATRGITDKSSEFADEGNFAHDILERARNENKPGKEYIGEVSECGRFTVDKEMAEAVDYFIDYFNQFESDEELNERKVVYDAWVEGGFGTLDGAHLNDGTWIIADFKYGQGIKVFAENNEQLKLYALGLFQEYSDMYECEKIKMCIVQPRLDWIDEWEISIEELLVWADEVVEPAADATQHDTAPFNAGPWCTKNFCKIRATCKTRMEAIKAGLLDEIADIRDPNEMDNAELGEAYAVAELATAWASDVKALVEQKVLAGEEVIGPDNQPMKMVAGRNTRAWRDQAEAEKAMRNYKIKVGDMWVRKFISPAQAEKLRSIGKNHPILKKHVVVTQGKPSLVYGSDPRPDFRTSSDEMDSYDEE
jgi:hypothetical protein